MTKSWLEHQCFQWSFSNQMIDHSHHCILGLAPFGLRVLEDGIDVVSHCSQVKNALLCISYFWFIDHATYTTINAAGPTTDSPDDPFVLVGAAHCNHICKDRNKGHVLETCCCRPPTDPGSCAQVCIPDEW